MIMSFSKGFLGLLFGVLAASQTYAIAGSPIEVQLPCRPNGSKANGLEECSKVIDQVVQLVTKATDQQIKLNYQGCDMTNAKDAPQGIRDLFAQNRCPGPDADPKFASLVFPHVCNI